MAKLANSRIALASPNRAANCEPDFVADRHSVDPLQHELQIEVQLELGNHDHKRCITSKRDDITPVNLAFDFEAELLKKAFDGEV